jgi:hypothetical protein
LISHNKTHCTIYEKYGVSRQEYYKGFITEYRDNFRPPDISSCDMLNTKDQPKTSGMPIPHDEPEPEYTRDKDGNLVIKKPDNKTHNEFDESTYTYFPEMVISKRKVISHNILIHKIIAEYKARFTRSKEVTFGNIKNIVLWVIQNPESILVMKSAMPKYDQIKLIFERLSKMGVLHLLYSDKDLNVITHREIIDKDGSKKLVSTNTEGKSIKSLFQSGLVDAVYYRIGVISTYQTIDHSNKEHIKNAFPFTSHEDD